MRWRLVWGGGEDEGSASERSVRSLYFASVRVLRCITLLSLVRRQGKDMLVFGCVLMMDD